MITEEKRKTITSNLPVNDPKYIAFKSLKGILGSIDIDNIRDDRISELIEKYEKLGDA